MSAPGAGAPSVDLALAAFRVGGAWDVQELTQHHLVDLDTLISALRRLPGDELGVLGIVALDDDFVLLRVVGETTRALVSDADAAEEWELVSDLLDFLDDEGGDSRDEIYVPPGDLGLFADLGVAADDLLDLVNDDDDDVSTVELLSEMAEDLGFGAQFDDVVGLAPV